MVVPSQLIVDWLEFQSFVTKKLNMYSFCISYISKTIKFAFVKAALLSAPIWIFSVSRAWDFSFTAYHWQLFIESFSYTIFHWPFIVGYFFLLPYLSAIFNQHFLYFFFSIGFFLLALPNPHPSTVTQTLLFKKMSGKVPHLLFYNVF